MALLLAGGWSPAVLATSAALVAGLMLGLWVVSLVRRDASIVDPWWSICFLLVSVNSAAYTPATPGKMVLLAMVGAWAVRLWLHLLLRHVGQPEDPRYAAMRRSWGARWWWVSLFHVFLLQGALALVISAPLQLATTATPPDPLTAWDAAGLALFLVGFAFEVVADLQLQAHRNDPSRRGQVLDRGLWRLSRHPNYFGEAVLWWGFWLCALDRPHGWATVFAPALMTFLLLRVSGVTMLDAHMRSTKPMYEAYMRRTPAFFPRW